MAEWSKDGARCKLYGAVHVERYAIRAEPVPSVASVVDAGAYSRQPHLRGGEGTACGSGRLGLRVTLDISLR